MPDLPVFAINTWPQDFFTLAGLTSPGRAYFKGASSPRKWDERPGYGTSGATTVWMGAKLARFTAIIEMWQAADLIDWEIFKTVLIKPPPGLPPIALGIGHPTLNGAPYNITDVVVEEVTCPEQDDFGLWTVQIKFIEYRRPMPAFAAAPSATIPSNGPAPPTAADGIRAEVAATSAEAAALGSRLR
jgi:hypothetical protein